MPHMPIARESHVFSLGGRTIADNDLLPLSKRTASDPYCRRSDRFQEKRKVGGNVPPFRRNGILAQAQTPGRTEVLQADKLVRNIRNIDAQIQRKETNLEDALAVVEDMLLQTNRLGMLPGKEWYRTPAERWKGLVKWIDEWEKLSPLAAKLSKRLEPRKDEPEVRLQLEVLEPILAAVGDQWVLDPHRMRQEVWQAYWLLKGVPKETGWRRLRFLEEKRKSKSWNANQRRDMTSTQFDAGLQRWKRLEPLARKLLARLRPLAEGQDVFEPPRLERDHLEEQVARGYRAGLVHQMEHAIREAYWALKGVPTEQGWRADGAGR